MRICFFSFLYIMVCLSGRVQSQDYNNTDSIAEMESRRFVPHLAKAVETFNGLNYDWKYALCQWQIDPNIKYITGRVVHTIYLLESADTIYFDFNQSLTIHNVLVNSEECAFYFADEFSLAVILNNTASQGNAIVEINYEGVPQNSYYLSFTQSFHGLVPEIYTLSEPYGAKDWWPCKHTLADKLDSVDIEITVPEGFKAGSNGKLISTTLNEDSTITYAWKHRYPIPAYLVSMAVTNYAAFSQYVDVEGSEIEILNYVYPERLELSQERAAKIPPLMELYSELFGIYPYADEKYGHAMTSIPGGMEHTTMSTMGSLSYNLSAHELAHQWFGNKVTCGSWEDIWLNEGFATYLNGLAIEFLGTAPEWQAFLESLKSSVFNLPGGSVLVNDTLSRDRIFDGRLTYNKGAYVLHMLRWKLGDDVFFQAIRNYLNDPAIAFGFASTADLQHHLEAESGQNLEEFFQDWYRGEGFPTYTLEWSKAENGVGFKLSQTSSHPSVAFFEMPVPIRFVGEGQERTLRFEHISNGQEFFAPLSFDVKSVEFDPGLRLLAKSTIRFDPGGKIDINKVSIFPNPTSYSKGLSVNVVNPFFHAELLEIIDAQGRRVLSQNRPEGYSGSFTVDIGGLQNGYYILNLVKDGSSINAPFILAAD